MIEEKIIEEKLKPLNEKIDKIYDVFGKNLGDQLLDRISISLDQFFVDFENKSSKSFESYWERILKINSDLSSQSIIKEDSSDGENVPKFIDEFNKKNKE